MQIQPVAAVDLAQPWVHRAPGVIHGRRSLGDGVQREIRLGVGCLERRVPERQRIEIRAHALAMPPGRLHRAVALRRQAELLQLLAVQLQDDRLGLLDEAHGARVLQIRSIGMLVEARFGYQLALPETAVLDVALQLLGVGLAATRLAAIGAAPARKRSDPGPAFVMHQVVGVAVRKFRRPIRIDHARQGEPRAQIEQHVLERPHVALGRQHRLTDRVRQGRRGTRSAGRAGRCSPSARDRWYPAGSDRRSRPSPRNRRPSR